MQCVPGITAPIGLIDGGAQVQCASNDGASCLWGSCPMVTTGSKLLAMPCPGWMGTNGIAACALLELAKKDEILPFMNNTDLSGGDYNSTHLPAGTDPHQCAALCMQDPNCMVWVYVIHGEPLGGGDCIFKTEKHSCPIPSPHSTSQGVCTSGRGHEPIGHNCYHPKPSGPPGPTKATLKVLTGETLDIRVLVDRPVVEIFVNKGRAAFVSADNSFHENHTKVALFNSGKAPVTANVSAFGMGCGWTKTKPTPKPPARDA